MKTGLFCVFENPTGQMDQAIHSQMAQVEHAETVGFDEAWVAEHHFNPDAVSPSILVLLANLAARTRRMRIGSAAVLLPFRDPIQVAEDVATLDILSNGRFDFGVAKGGPFPSQNRHFGVGQDVSRDRMTEALDIIRRLLAGETVSHHSACYHLDQVTLAPLPVQRPIPIWVASTTDHVIDHAAAHGHGLMGASPFPLPKLQAMVQRYRQARPGADPDLALARFYYAAPTRDEAVAEALPFIRRFSERMRGIFLAQGAQVPFDADGLMDRSLVGSYQEVVDKIGRLHDAVAPGHLLLKPTSLDPDKCLRALDAFAQHIRPHLPATDGAAP